MIFKNRLIMAVFALSLMGTMFIILSKQAKLQNQEADQLLPALSPTSTRTPARLPAWMSTIPSPGQVVYINFWASWCEPCKEELPYIESLKSKLEKEGLKIVLVNLDYGESAIQTAKKMKAELAPHTESLYESATATRAQLNLKGLPYHTLIDRSGKVAMSFYAPLAQHKAAFKRRVQSLLAEKASP